MSGLRRLSTSLLSWKAKDWHHLAFSWNSSEICLYLDGKRVADSENFIGGIPSGLSDLSNTMQVGCRRYFTSYREQADSIIDELYIYDKALSPKEIEELYMQIPTKNITSKKEPEEKKEEKVFQVKKWR